MRFFSRILTLRAVLVGLVSVLSLVSALPAFPNSDPGAKPASLLGRSYTRRASDSSSAVLDSRRLALDAPKQQRDSLGRAARFQIALRRAASVFGSLRAENTNDDERGSLEGKRREMLLSHQQLVPSPVSSLLTSSTAPAIPIAASARPPPPIATSSSVAPNSGSRAVEKAKSKSKSKKTKTAPKHSGHKTKVIHESAE